MRQLKNLNFKFEKERKISLDDFILFCIETTIDISSFPVDNDLGLRAEYEIKKKYNIETDAAAKLYKPVWWYLTLNEYKFNKKTSKMECVHKAPIPSKGYNEWNPSKKIKNLTKKGKINIIRKIILEHKEYYYANIEKFNLCNLFL